MNNSSIPWFLHPPALVDTEARFNNLTARAGAQPPQPTAARPERDYDGNEIPRMRVSSTRIAVIPVQGPLLKGAPGSAKRAGFASYEDIHEDMDAAVSNGAKGILFHINSPGGTAVGAGELAERVAILAKRMPVYSYTEDMQCSAAEYLSGACSARFAAPGAITGSIGTILTSVSFQGLLEKMGIKATVFASGKYKGAGHPARDLTPDQTEYLQSFVNTLAAEFKTHMLTHRRSMSAEMMEGQVFTGRQASQNGLIDALASSLGEVLSLIG